MATFPRWKILTIVLVLIFGVIYSLPNVFPQYPTIQISGVDKIKADTLILDQAKEVLQKHQLSWHSAELEGDNLVTIRFNDTDTSLKAKEFIKFTPTKNPKTLSSKLFPTT